MGDTVAKCGIAGDGDGQVDSESEREGALDDANNALGRGTPNQRHLVAYAHDVLMARVRKRVDGQRAKYRLRVADGDDGSSATAHHLCALCAT